MGPQQQPSPPDLPAEIAVPILRGLRRRLYAYRCPDGSVPARDFLDLLPEDVRGRYALHIKDFCETGQIRGTFGHTLASKNHRECRGLSEFKDNQSQTRLLGFAEGFPGIIVLTHGFGGKKEDKLSETEIARCRRIREEYEQRKPIALARTQQPPDRASGHGKGRKR